MIHRYALASKTLPDPLLDSLKLLTYITKFGSLNTRLFKELCNDMDADHEVLLSHTVRVLD